MRSLKRQEVECREDSSIQLKIWSLVHHEKSLKNQE